MITRRKAIVRSALCILLGAVTTWMVAWGIEILDWRSPAPPGLKSTQAREPLVPPGLALSDQHIVSVHDRPAPFGTLRRSWEILEFADEHEQELVEREGPARKSSKALEPSIGWERYIAHQRTAWKNGERLDDLAAKFDASHLWRFVGDLPETTMEIHQAGWPGAAAEKAWVWQQGVVSPGSPYGSRMQWHWSIEVVPGPTVFFGMPNDGGLRLPLRPIWPGFLLDTGFYGVLWAVPFFGLPLLKQSRRKRKGRCPNCAYDLKRDFQSGCPECGWRRERAG